MRLIVGVDPGTTAGVAVLDFGGGLVEVFSSKDLSMDRIIEHVIRLGRVSVIASDVSPAPSFASKLAAQLGAVVHSPPESLSVVEKTELTRPFKTRDAHQRDALAAALVAFQKYRNVFQKIDSRGLGDEVKHLVVRGYSINEAVRVLEEKEEYMPVPPSVVPEPVLSPEEKRIRRLKKQNRLLKKQLEEGRKEKEELGERLSSVRARFRVDLRRDSEVRKRDRVIDSLKKSLVRLRNRISESESLRHLWNKAGSGVIQPVGVFPEAFNGFSYVKRRLRKKDLELLDSIEVAFSEHESDYSLFADAGVLATDTEFLRESGGCFFIRVEDIEKLAAKSVSLDRIVEEYRGGRA